MNIKGLWSRRWILVGRRNNTFTFIDAGTFDEMQELKSNYQLARMAGYNRYNEFQIRSW